MKASKFNRGQLLLITDLALSTAMESIYGMMPVSTSMADFLSRRKATYDECSAMAGRVNYYLACLWAHLNDDGMEAETVEDCGGFEKFAKAYIDKCSAGWRAQSDGRCWPDTTPLSTKIVDELFYEYLGKKPKLTVEDNGVYYGLDLMGEFSDGKFLPNLDLMNMPAAFQRKVAEFAKNNAPQETAKV